MREVKIMKREVRMKAEGSCIVLGESTVADQEKCGMIYQIHMLRNVWRQTEGVDIISLPVQVS